uniref:Chromosome 6 open reading frame 118 n=1 Tax=Anser cygnoides TaxID=8845 RepID=A0A8B9EF59_ANSCY
MTERNQFLAENERTRKMKNCSGNFSSSIPLLPAQAESSFPNNRHPQSPVTSVGASADASSTVPEILKLKALKKKVEEGTDRFHMRLKRKELNMSEIMVLKNKPVKNSRQCAAELAKEYQFIPLYLAGVTKTDQFNKFLHFQKEFIAKHELLQNDFTGKKVSEQHERKLAKELQNICGCDPLNFKRLQAAEEAFEDICNSSLIFGDILKEIKSEYELYITMVLDSLPIAQYKVVFGYQSFLRCQVTSTPSSVLLTTSLCVSVFILPETCRRQETKGAQKPLSVSEQHESMRCKILSKWEEMKMLETKKKETMVYAGITDIMENTLKEIEQACIENCAIQSNVQNLK